MRTLNLIVVTLLLHIPVFGQPVSYKIPAAYESEIGSDDYKKLVDISVRIVANRFAIEKVEEGAIHLKAGQEMETLNLHNLIAKCNSEKDESRWEGIIRAHFDNLFSSIDEQKKIDPANFESVKKYLSIRIYPKATVMERGGTENLISKSDLEGTLSLLMLDLHGAFTPVQMPMFAIWKRDTEEVFKLAQENVNKQVISKATQQFEIDGQKLEISFLESDDYAASYVLDMANNSPELVGEFGAVVVVPNKGLAIVCKISKSRPTDFVKVIERIRPLTKASFVEHAQPVSTEYFWYQNGKFTRIPIVEEVNGSINIIAPPGLTELMKKEK